MTKKFGGKAFAVLGLELLVFLMIAAGFLSMAFPVTAVAAIEAVLALLFFYCLFEARKYFQNDFRPMAIFFVFLFALAVVSFAAQLLPVTEATLRLQLFFAIAVVAIAFFILFRIVFGRNTVHGKIVSVEKGNAVVEAEFDFLAGINAEKFTVRAGKGNKEGQKVLLKVQQGIFSRKPTEIIE